MSLDATGLDVVSQGILPDGHRGVVIGVGTFTPHQSLGYLIGRLTADLDQRQGAVDLVPQLGREPLALAQASAVIASSELTCHGYLDILTSRQARRGADVASSPAAVTWSIAVEHADTLSAAAHPQLIFCALLDGNGVPATILSEAARLHEVDEKTSQEGLDSAEAAGLLSVDRSSPAALTRMNAIVQAAIRAATPPDMLAATVVAAADVLLTAWPDDACDLGRVYRSCTDQLRRLGKGALWQDGCHRVLLRAGQSLEAAGLARCAADYWEELTATSVRVLGEGHPDTLALHGRLGLAYLESGQADQAAALFRAVGSERARSLGQDHSGTARAWLDLSRALVAGGRLDEAIAVLGDAVACFERATGPDSGESLSAQEDLAAAHARVGQASAAITLYRRTLAVRQRAHGPAHPDAISTCRKLADAYLADGQVKNAISLYKRVLDERRDALGEGHQDTIAARGALAGAYFTAGRVSRALQLLEQVRVEYIRAIGAEHRTTLATSLNLANAYHSVGRLTDAARLLEGTAQLCEQNLLDSDPLTQAAREALAAMTGTGQH